MKIVVDYNHLDIQSLKIDKAEYLNPYKVRILFDDGIERIVDFKPFLNKSLHPSIQKYLDENQFSKFQIVDGNLNWNDYDMIFPIWDLYNGKIE